MSCRFNRQVYPSRYQGWLCTHILKNISWQIIRLGLPLRFPRPPFKAPKVRAIIAWGDSPRVGFLLSALKVRHIWLTAMPCVAELYRWFCNRPGLQPSASCHSTQGCTLGYYRSGRCPFKMQVHLWEVSSGALPQQYPKFVMGNHK